MKEYKLHHHQEKIIEWINQGKRFTVSLPRKYGRVALFKRLKELGLTQHERK